MDAGVPFQVGSGLNACTHPEEAGASPPEAWAAAAPLSSSQPGGAGKHVSHPSTAAPSPDGPPGLSPQQAGCTLLPAVTRPPACDPHRLPRSFRRGPLPAGRTPRLQAGCPRPSAVWAQTSVPSASASSLTQPLRAPSFPSPTSRRQSCGLFFRLAACSPLRASTQALPSAQATFPPSLQPQEAGVS